MLLAQTLSTTPRSFLAITAKAAFDWEMAALTLSLTVPAGGGAHFTESLLRWRVSQGDKIREYSLNLELILKQAALISAGLAR